MGIMSDIKTHLSGSEKDGVIWTQAKSDAGASSFAITTKHDMSPARRRLVPFFEVDDFFTARMCAFAILFGIFHTISFKDHRSTIRPGSREAFRKSLQEQ